MSARFVFWLLAFAVSSCSAVLVNKYVLWMLRFTYPTIYQSWQMFVAAFLLYLLHLLGYIELEPVKRTRISAWSPAVAMFTVSIYSGSKALARLPVPIFCILQQKLLNCSLNLVNLWKGAAVSIYYIWTITESMFCVSLVLLHDADFSLENYKWLFLHCFSMSLYSFYALCVVDIELKEVDKMIMNSTASIFILMLFGLLSGETISVLEFQLLYHRHFHLACICSGVFGTFIMLSYCKLCHYISVAMIRFYNVFVMFLISFLSLFVFSTVLNASLLCIILGGFTCTIWELYYALFWMKDAKVDKVKQDTNQEVMIEVIKKI